MNDTGEGGKQGPAELSIPLGRRRRLLGIIGYVAFFLAVCGALVGFFLFFATPAKLAIALVLFMVAYMLIMGWWTSRDGEGKQ